MSAVDRGRRIVLKGLAGFAAGGLVGGAGAGGEAPPATIRISTGAGSPFGRPYSGANSGLAAERRVVEQEFAADGVKIEWHHLKGGGPASNEALANGSVDIGFAGDFPAIFGRAGGLKTRLIGAGFRGANAYLYVAGGSPVRRVEDLLGKRIAIMRSQPWEYSLDRLIRSKGHAPRDFQIVNLNFPDARSALESGDIEAIYSPWLDARLEREGKLRAIWSTREAARDWRFAADFLVDDEFARRYPTAVKRFAKAVIVVNHWASKPENAEAVYAIWALGGYPVDNFRREYDGDSAEDLKFRYSPRLDEFKRQHYRKAAQYMFENKLIRRRIDIDDWFEPSFVEDAIRDLALEGYWVDYDAAGQPAASAANVTRVGA